MSDYPNIEAIAHGTISGSFADWPRVKPEAKALLAELAEEQAYARQQKHLRTECESELAAANERAEKALRHIEMGTDKAMALSAPDQRQAGLRGDVYCSLKSAREALHSTPAATPAAKPEEA